MQARPNLLSRALFLALITFIGCGKSEELKRTEVSGTVTYNGTAIEDGEISFLPVEGVNAPPSSGTITKGEYKLNQGLAAGTYSVQIRAYKPSTQTELSPGGLDKPQSVGIPNRDQILPEKFNTKSTLEKLTIDSKDTAVQKNYDLKD